MNGPLWPWLALALATFAWWVGVGPPDYFYWSSLLVASGTLAIAAVSQLFVLASGSQGLGGGASISLVNVLVVTYLRDDPSSIALWVVLGPLIGAGVGAINGALVGLLSLSSVVVTLATSFMVYGVTLTFLDNMVASAPASFTRLVTGDAIPDMIPATLTILAACIAAGFLVLRSRFGQALFAVGRDIDAARRAGIPAGRVRMIAHTLAGAGYGLAGVFVSGVTGSADPLIGAPTVLQIYAAAAIGGVALGGGRGGPLGAAIGALTLASATGLLFVAEIPAYWSTAVEGALLIFGLILSGSRVPGIPYRDIRLALFRRERAGQGSDPPEWPAIQAGAKSPIGPAAIVLTTVVLATAAIDRPFDAGGYLANLGAAATLLAFLAIGQTLVMAVRGIDVALPAIMALSASLFATLASGSDRLAAVAAPAVVVLAVAVAGISGAAVALLGLRPLFVTLAMTGVLQAVVIDANMWSNERFVSSGVFKLLTGSVAGVPFAILMLEVFALAVAALIQRSRLHATILAVGRGETAPPRRLGVALIAVHALAGLCAGVAGVLGSIEPAPARFGVGDTYLLPSVAAALFGGIVLTGRRPQIGGALLGALLVTAVSIALERAGLHYGFGQAVVGLLLVAWVIAARLARRSNV